MRALVRPLLVVAAVLLPLTSYAQSQGAIAGVVRDPSNAVIPGVTVEVSSPALIEKVRSTTTDDNGRYQITALPVGTYTVKFSLQGFSTVERANVQLNADFTAPVNVQLAVGNLTDVVTVVAESPAVDVQNARVQYVFSGSDIAELPTERDLGGLLNLVPSISNPNGSCIGGVGLFCNGIAPAFNSHVSAADADGQNQGRIVVDGMTINRGASAQGINLNTGATNGISFDTANVQELTFTLSGALGESETGGASITIVPRTGGNRFAGSYFTSYLDDKFFGNNRKTRLIGIPDGTNDIVYDYDINGSFGGPIKKDKLWFFVNGRVRKDEKYPNNGLVGGFANLNEGQFAQNYQPLRGDGSQDYWLTYTNEQKNLAGRFTLQLTQKNKFNLAWDEQDACTNPCGGMINIVDSPESYFSLQNRPNRLRSASWTNPFTNKVLFEAGLTAINTTQNSTEHREYKNRPELPRICEQGSTTGMDAFATKVNTTITDDVTTNGGAGQCSIFFTMISGSVNEAFNNNSGFQKQVDDTYRSRASASYVTGSHNAKIGWEGAYFGEKTTNPVNDQRAAYHYGTPDASCLTTAATAANPWPCGNMTLLWPNDPTNRDRRPRPIGLEYNTGAATANEHVWFGALYVQDQWTLKRFTISGAIRYDHAQSGYGQTCFGPDKYVPIQEDGKDFWCSTPADGVSYNDVTPRWGVAWDVFGTGKTSVKYNMGKYLQAAGFGGLYTDNNSARRTNNQLTRLWDDVNGNRLVDCDLLNPNQQAAPGGDICGSLLQTSGPNAGQPTTQFATFGRPPTATQLFTANSFCGRTENSSQLHRDYCAASGQNLLSGSGVRRSEWQFGIGVQHEILPRLSGEVTYNWRKYQNLTDSDTVGRGCDYFDFGGQSTDQCYDNLLNFIAPQHDFFSFTVPVDPRLPGGGGYVIRGVNNQKVRGNVGGSGDVTTIQEVLDYTWNGVDTNWVYRGPRGIRIAGGTSTGRSLRDTCRVDGDLSGGTGATAYKGREGNLYGGGCRVHNPFQTNVRANGSYTIPWVDVLAGVVFQSRPGSALAANLQVPFQAAVWEPTATPGRAGQPFNGNSLTTGVNTVQVNLLDTGDLYGERQNNWDLTLRKNFRFAGKRANFGVDIYNIFNSDAATGYVNTYTAAYNAGVWTVQNDDNPATTVIEGFGNINGIVNPRFFRLSMSLDF